MEHSKHAESAPDAGQMWTVDREEPAHIWRASLAEAALQLTFARKFLNEVRLSHQAQMDSTALAAQQAQVGTAISPDSLNGSRRSR